MVSIKDKLRGIQKSVSATPPLPDRSEKKDALVAELGASIIQNELGEFVLREKRYPLDFMHGSALGDFLKLESMDFIYAGKTHDLRDMSPENIIFLDTETTGLAGGTGTYPFMIGAGFFDNNEYVVQQYFMRDYHEEPAMLQGLAQLFQDRNAIISFNGKSYDLPTLTTRYILNRLPVPWENHLHLDILHTSRRLWKDRVVPCTLQNLEQHLLGFKRHGDVPGYEIPMIYFDYLRQGEYEPLIPVFKHNVMDILSMVTITVAISKAFKTPTAVDSYDILGVVRTFEDLELYDLAISICEQNTLPQVNNAIDILIKQSYLLKRLKNFDKTETLWLEIIDRSSRFLPFAYIELAKYYEHQVKDYIKALEIVERAMERVRVLEELRGLIHECTPELEHRRQRLLGKKEKGTDRD